MLSKTLANSNTVDPQLSEKLQQNVLQSAAQNFHIDKSFMDFTLGRLVDEKRSIRASLKVSQL